MLSNGELLKKELASYHILLENNNKMCYVLHKGRYIPIPIGKKINILIRDLYINKDLMESLFKDLLELLEKNIKEQVFVDQKSINLFLVSLRDFLYLFDSNLNINNFTLKNLDIKTVYLKLKEIGRAHV